MEHLRKRKTVCFMDNETEKIAEGLRKHVHAECFNTPGLTVDVTIIDSEIHVIVRRGARQVGRMVVQRGTGLLSSKWHYGFVGIAGHGTIFEMVHALRETFAEAGIRSDHTAYPV